MPLIGIVDPSHEERALDEPGRLPRWMTLDELVERSLHEEPRWAPWPYEMVNAALDLHFALGDALNVTGILAGCPRAEVLKRKVDFIDYLDNLYASLRGTGTHRFMQEYAREGSVAEVRFETTVDGLTVTCTPDLITTDSIYDWKQTENPPAYQFPYRHHTEQVQFNRYVVNHAERWHSHGGGDNPPLPWDPRSLVFTHLVLVYLGPRWPKLLECTHKVEMETPNHKKVKRSVPYVWDDEKVLEEFRPRLHTLANALESFPTWPHGAEKVWGGPPDWRCPGPPLCRIPNCLARRWPDHMVWDQPKR